jgi:hypothetical protein
MISISTRGRLAATAAAITIATIGWLSISTVPPIPPSGGGGGGGYTYGGSHKTNVLEERKKKIKQDEQEWMLFIKIFTEQCL